MSSEPRFRSDNPLPITLEELNEIEGQWAFSYGSNPGEDGGWAMRAIARLLDEARSHYPGLCYLLWPGGPNGEQIACGFPRHHAGPHSWSWVPTVTGDDR